MFISEDSLDDLLRAVIAQIDAEGVHIAPKRGAATELTGVLLEIKDPRARLSRTETRGKIFSCLGELCWYLAGSDDAGFIGYYLSEYLKSADRDVVCGAYGPRMFAWDGQNQIQDAIAMLRRRTESRKAVVQIFDASDLSITLKDNKTDVPCTCTLQFLIRDGRLQMFTFMRSNDVHKGLVHDVFAFTMLQEIMARSLSVEVGVYKHAVGSLHLYDDDLEAARRFQKEGWQSTDLHMPPMPVGDPWQAIRALLVAEREIRESGTFDKSKVEGLDAYWVDLVNLLQTFRFKEDSKRVKSMRTHLTSDVYRPFVDGLASRANE